MRRTLLLDADIIAYKFASAAETVVYFNGRDEEPAVDSDFEAAMRGAEEYIAELVDTLHADSVTVCLTDPEANFRKQLWPGYKAKRAGMRKPTDLMRLKEWFAERYATYQRPALEADDCMGILATHPTLIKGEKIIVSEDKDMQSVPGLLYNPAKDSEPRKISRLAADRYHLWQTIVGDSSDGYPGAPGIGPRSPEARAVLASKSVEEAWHHVLAAFRRAHLKATGKEAKDADVMDAAILQARLARILRASDWEFKEKRPKLWTPPITPDHR